MCSSLGKRHQIPQRRQQNQKNFRDDHEARVQRVVQENYGGSAVRCVCKLLCLRNADALKCDQTTRFEAHSMAH
jgi:hypothetical protein